MKPAGTNANLSTNAAIFYTKGPLRHVEAFGPSNRQNMMSGMDVAASWDLQQLGLLPFELQQCIAPDNNSWRNSVHTVL